MRSVLKNQRAAAQVPTHDSHRRFTRTFAAAFIFVAVPLLNFAAAGFVRAQDRNARPSEIKQTPSRTTPTFDGERAFAHVRALVEFGPRPAGSKELARARAYISGELKSYGLKVAEDGFDAKTPVGKRRMFNVTAELKGESDDLIIIASHYDTKPYKQFRFVGANDGGSSTGALLELARALAAASPRPHFSYRFVFFDGEEAFCAEWDECGKPNAPDNTYGSRRYVERLRANGELNRLRALILLDMMGYEKLEMGRDDMSTSWLVEIIWQTARELGYSKQFADRTEGVGGDDHEPFLRAGVASVDLIQLNTYPHWHTPEDTLDKISAGSLKAVGDVVLASLPRIEEHMLKATELLGKPFKEVKSKAFDGVIFPAEYSIGKLCRNGSKSCERWTPSEDDVLRLEQRVEAYLTGQGAKGTQRIVEKLADYKRQYVGIVRDGHKIIWINFFCDNFSSDWHKDIVIVDDGGDCFFNLNYDIESKTFTDLSINGVA